MCDYTEHVVNTPYCACVGFDFDFVCIILFENISGTFRVAFVEI